MKAAASSTVTSAITSSVKRSWRFYVQAESISGIKDWRRITPDRHHDWIGQRSEAFQKFYPMGTKKTKAGKADDAIFGSIQQMVTIPVRDAYIYNFSRDNCAENARRMVEDYQWCSSGS